MKRSLCLFVSLFFVVVGSAWASVDFSGEFRLRPEYRGNPDFNDRTHENNAFVGSRLRITGAGSAAENVAVKFTVQDTRNWGEEAAGTTGLTDSGEVIDLHEGYVEFKNVFQKPFHFRAGRQELSYGDQRLVGPVGWSHQGRAFDAFRLYTDNLAYALDVFTAKRRETNATSTSSSSADDRDFSGVYTTWKKIIPQSVVDLYVFHDREGSTSGALKSKNIVTVGTRLAGKSNSLDYTLELPYQFGDNGTIVGASSTDVKINAFAFAAKAGYTLAGPKAVRLGLEYNFASGDDDASDSTARTFNNLYPTNHAFYGYMDNQGWRNMQGTHFSVSAKPTKECFVSAGLWNFRLAEEKDGWYNAGGAASGFRGASATNTRKNVGNEFDLLFRHTQNASVTWEIGYGHFFTGSYINQRVQNEGDSDWTYVMSTVRF